MNGILNDSVINESRTHRMQMSSTEMPMLRLRYQRGQSKDPEAPTDFCRVWIDANLSASTSKVVVGLDIGASSSDYTQHQFSVDATAASDPDGIDASPTQHQVTTLGAMIAAMNAITGVTAVRLNGPADFSLNTDVMEDLLTTSRKEVQAIKPTDVLYQTKTTGNAVYMRVGNPEVQDSGRMCLIYLGGTITGVTNGTVKIYRDPDETVATNVKEFRSFTMGTTGVITDYIDRKRGEEATYRGPLLIVADSDDNSAVDLVLEERQASY